MKSTPKQTSPKWLIGLLACALSCAVLWGYLAISTDETTTMKVHVTSVCASIMSVAEAIDRCNADYVVSLYADILVQCEQAHGEPFNVDGYRQCMEGLGIRLQ